ncbi:hypothetical protein [Candidatus Binatus sp.]|uniref:hypothetical protein n=1 Tax=Candidatus Binatus sp. TaxID=2811406 RepID=UPI003BAF6CAC
MNPTDYFALDETLEAMAPIGPDLSNGFSYHAPMAIEAMCAMDRGDAVKPWFERYRRDSASDTLTDPLFFGRPRPLA